MLRRIVELAVPVSRGRRGRVRLTVAALGLAAVIAPIAADGAAAQGTTEVILECQQLDNALNQRGDLDVQSAKRLAERALRDRPTCGYVFARFLRLKRLIASAEGLQMADDALKSTQDYLLPSAEGYAYFLKEAIRIGMITGSKWRSNVAANLVALKNVAPAEYPAFEAQMFEGCVRYVGNPFEAAASCTVQDWMPADLRGKIQSAANQRAKLDEACTFLRQPRLDDVVRCKRAFNDARNAGYTDGHFAMYTERVRVAEEQIALADTVAACTFQAGDAGAIESRFDQVMRCDGLLRNKDPNKETIRASREALAAELDRLEPRLRPTGDLSEIKRICDLRNRLSPFAELYGKRFADVCPAIPQDVATIEQTLKSYIERPAIARPQQGSRARLGLPGFAQKLDDDCLDRLTDFRSASDRQARMAKFEFLGGAYVNGCSPVLGSIIQRLAGMRLGELLGAPAVPSAPRGQPGTTFIRPEEILSRWTGMATDRILLPSTVAVLEQEAALIAEIVNYRAETIERALGERCQGRPESGLLTWLGGNRPNVQSAIDSVQKLTEANSPLGRLLDPAKQTEVSSKISAWRQPGALCHQAAPATAASASPVSQAPSPSQPAQTVQSVPQPQPAMRPAAQTTHGHSALDGCGPSANLPSMHCIEQIRHRYALENSAREGGIRLAVGNLKPPVQQLPPQLSDNLVTKANDHLHDAGKRCGQLMVRDWTTISQELRVMADLFDDLSASIMLRLSRTAEDCIPAARRN